MTARARRVRNCVTERNLKMADNTFAVPELCDGVPALCASAFECIFIIERNTTTHSDRKKWALTAGPMAFHELQSVVEMLKVIEERTAAETEAAIDTSGIVLINVLKLRAWSRLFGLGEPNQVSSQYCRLAHSIDIYILAL